MCPAISFYTHSAYLTASKHKQLPTTAFKNTPAVCCKFSLFCDRNADICYLFAYECPPANVCKTQLRRSSTLLSEMLKTQQVVTVSIIKSRPTAPLCGRTLAWQSEIQEVTLPLRSEKFTSKKKNKKNFYYRKSPCSRVHNRFVKALLTAPMLNNRLEGHETI